MNYLIVGPAWVGDMIMAQSLFMALQQQHPEATIDVLAPAWSQPVLARMPEVRNSVAMPIGHGRLALATRYRLGRSLQAACYSHAIVLPNSFKSALIPFWARIPVRTGWRGEWRYGLLNDLRILDKNRLPQMVERFVALAYPKHAALPKPLPKPTLQVDASQANRTRHRYGLSLERPALVLCPGAEFGTSKQWPTRHYSAVAEHKLNQGWQVWLLGAGNDRPVAAAVVKQLPNAQQTRCYNLAGQTPLADAIDLLALAQAVVSNDSGLMHIAAALAKPLVAIYGSTTAAHTPPMNDNSRILWLGLACSPCFQRHCPLQHHQCMQQLTPDQVIAALADLLRTCSESYESVQDKAKSDEKTEFIPNK